MDKIRYNQDEDPSGAIGPSLANIVLQRSRYSGKPVFSKENSGNRKSIKDIVTPAPKIIGSAPNANYLIRQNLKNLRNEGYPVNKNYTKMNSTDLWIYFLAVLKENNYFDSS